MSDILQVLFGDLLAHAGQNRVAPVFQPITLAVHLTATLMATMSCSRCKLNMVTSTWSRADTFLLFAFK